MADKIEYRREALARFREACKGLPEDYPVRIERSCYNTTIKKNIEAGQSIILGDIEFISRYDAIVTRVLLNLRSYSTVGSKELYTALQSGLSPDNIGMTQSAELSPSINADIRETLEIRSRQKVIQKISTAYKCRKCGESKTTYEEYQGRSGDEASKMSFKCLVCHNIWNK